MSTLALNQGSVPFANASGLLTENSSELHWDNSNKELGVGTSSPNEKVTVDGVISFSEVTSPTATTGYGKIYVKSDGLYFMDESGTEQKISSSSSTAVTVRDLSRGLAIKNNTTNPAYQVDTDADEVVLKDDSSGTPYLAENVNLTIDITATGANGRDEGDSETPSTWYYIWVIYNGTTVAGLLSTSSTSPTTMPTGYTYKALVGAIYNDSSSDFITLEQRERFVSVLAQNAVSSKTDTDYTEADISDYVPVTAKKISGKFQAQDAGNQMNAYIAATSSGLNEIHFISADYSGTFYSLNLVEPQALYHKVQAGDTISAITISGWEY